MTSIRIHQKDIGGFNFHYTDAASHGNGSGFAFIRGDGFNTVFYCTEDSSLTADGKYILAARDTNCFWVRVNQYSKLGQVIAFQQTIDLKITTGSNGTPTFSSTLLLDLNDASNYVTLDTTEITFDEGLWQVTFYPSVEGVSGGICYVDIEKSDGDGTVIPTNICNIRPNTNSFKSSGICSSIVDAKINPVSIKVRGTAESGYFTLRGESRTSLSCTLVAVRRG